MTHDDAIKIIKARKWGHSIELEAMEMAIRALEETKPRGTYQCFHCCNPHSVVWDSDFTFEDYCIEGDGIVQNLHCSCCGAEIQYFVRFDEEEE